MSFLDELVSATQGPTSAWHEFVLIHRKEAEAYYVFLEGDLDVPFYISALRLVLGDSTQVRELRCGGREGVLDAQANVRRTHPHCTRCLFFIDKDLQDFLGGFATTQDDLYCTDWYSIEITL
jgi:Protein of unknown function (DUF4435)